MQEPSGSATNTATRGGGTAELFAAFMRFGLTSFGGSIADLSYFHEEFVVRPKWLDRKAYFDLMP
jgi:chromate transporter